MNTLARSGPPEWFRDTVVTTVPPPYAGAGRRVYPGFLQLAGFVAMNPKRHLDAHLGLFEALVAGDDLGARATRDFYDEYFAVSDLPAEVYLETITQIFQGNLLARGEYTWRGRRVRPERITRTGLLTVEGERDDICGPGQTMAAHELCTRIPAVPPPPPPAGRGRALRGVQRAALGGPGLPGGAQLHRGEQLTAGAGPVGGHSWMPPAAAWMNAAFTWFAVCSASR